ncbi:hypothetical protein HanPI659440_Chr04g0181911 [Helianthus annuus]|nr:hypothetical protein HanPI659440_Chr04g0181911 [Helianthus annuus]
MKCRIELEKARLLIFEVADQLDLFRNKKAHGALAMAKVVECGIGKGVGESHVASMSKGNTAPLFCSVKKRHPPWDGEEDGVRWR